MPLKMAAATLIATLLARVAEYGPYPPQLLERTTCCCESVWILASRFPELYYLPDHLWFRNDKRLGWNEHGALYSSKLQEKKRHTMANH